MEIRTMQRNLEMHRPLIPWLTHERRNWVAAVVLAFFCGYAGANGHTTQGAIEHISQQYGQQGVTLQKAVTAAHCEERRVARAADQGEEPPDDCPHVIVKKGK